MSTRATRSVRDEAREAPPVFAFFVGCGRSGTSLLRAIFDSHPDMHVPRDTYFILNLESNRRRYESRAGFDVEAFVKDLGGQFDFKRWPIGIEEIAADLRERPPGDYPDAIRQVFRLCARSQGKARYGNKSPVHVRGMPGLARLFPEARFVHIIRDGRNVARSYLEVDFGPKTIEGAALRWRRHVSTGRRDGARLGPARYMEVRYEQILEDPEATIRRLCLFLDVPFDERTLRYSERTEDMFVGKKPPKHHRNLALPPTKGLRDWHTEMSPDDVATFEALAGGLLEELGYDRGCPNPGLGVRVRAQARLLAEGLRRATRKLRRRPGPPPGSS
jgi:hypothetical protein